MTELQPHHRVGDAEPVRITREIPLAWLIGVVVGLGVQAITLYLGQQQQAEMLRTMSSELKEMRVIVQQGTLKDVEYGMRLDDHERRMNAVEAKVQPAQEQAARRAADAAGNRGGR